MANIRMKLAPAFSGKAFRLLVATLVCLLVATIEGLHLDGTTQTYVKYPKWQACQNGSLSFQFRTDREHGLLMYTDDGGQFDFFEIRLIKGEAVVRFNLAEKKEAEEEEEASEQPDPGEGVEKLFAGRELNDRRWHQVMIRRNEQETVLQVDDDLKSVPSKGIDFNFGDIDSNNYVFFGGLPSEYMRNLPSLALPSVMFEHRFKGQIRNVMYSNCSCPMRTATFLNFKDAGQLNICERSEPCDDGCDCIVVDVAPGYKCDCSPKICGEVPLRRYHLPMDDVEGTAVLNPSGLKSDVTGPFVLRTPIVGKSAIQLDKDSNIVIRSLRGRRDCLTNIEFCTTGFTLATWLMFGPSDKSQIIYISHGQNDGEPGLRVSYEEGLLSVSVIVPQRDDASSRQPSSVIRPPYGQKWIVKTPIQLLTTHHLAVMWDVEGGLRLFLDGVEAASDSTPERLLLPSSKPGWRFGLDSSSSLGGGGEEEEEEEEESGRHFRLILGGNPNGRTSAMAVIDDLHFWTGILPEEDLDQYAGSIRGVRFQMDALQGNVLPVSSASPSSSSSSSSLMRGSVMNEPLLVKGKVGHALRLEGDAQYVKIGSTPTTPACLMTDLSFCPRGLTIRSWLLFGSLEFEFHVLSARGASVFTLNKGGATSLVSKFQTVDKSWTAEYENIRPGVWYWMELSWSPERGLELFIDGSLVAQDEKPKPIRDALGEEEKEEEEILIGVGGEGSTPRVYADIVVDELEIWSASKEKLVEYNFVPRDSVPKYLFDMDSMEGKRMIYGDVTGYAYGNPDAIDGMIGKALSLKQKNQYVLFSENGENWMQNSELNPHGLTLSVWLRFNSFQDGVTYLFTNGLRVTSKDGVLVFTVSTWRQIWETMVEGIETNKWYLVEVDWHPQGDLKVLVDGVPVGVSGSASTKETRKAKTYKMLIGRSPSTAELGLDGGGGGDGRGDAEQPAADVDVDQLAVYSGRRDRLIADGTIMRNQPGHYLFEMEETKREREGVKRLINPYFPVLLKGKASLASGKVGKALRLTGDGQYVDMGAHPDQCFGNLDLCKHGITISFLLSTGELIDNMYYISAPGMDFYYRSGHFWTSFTMGDRNWQLSSSEGVRPGVWYHVEITWHPDKGLSLYLDGKKAGEAVKSEYVREGSQSSQAEIFLGRAGAAKGGIYGDFMMDRLEVWEAWKPLLAAFNFFNADGEIVEARFRDDQKAADDSPYLKYTYPTVGGDKEELESEQLEFDFKSSSERGLLLFASHEGGSYYYINYEPTGFEGQTYVTVDVRTSEGATLGTDVILAKDGQNRINDGQWHHVKLVKEEDKLMLSVDDEEAKPVASSQVPSSILDGYDFYFGGGPQGSSSINTKYGFKGSLQKVTADRSDVGQIEMLPQIRRGSLGTQVKGYVEFSPSLGGVTPAPTEPPKPASIHHVTIESPEILVEFVGALQSTDSHTIELSFTTNEAEGLLLLAKSPVADSFLALEIKDSLLYFVANGGGNAETLRVLVAREKVNDRNPYKVHLNLDGMTGSINLSGKDVYNVESFELPGAGNTISGLDAEAHVFVGGVPIGLKNKPWTLWANRGFAGCIMDVTLYGEKIDFSEPIQKIRKLGDASHIKAGCAAPRQPLCLTGPCDNDGVCTDGWNSFTCDCSATRFAGPTCNKPLRPMKFKGKKQYKIDFGTTPSSSDAEDVSIRFATIDADGDIIETSGQNGAVLKFGLEEGVGVAVYEIGAEQKVMRAGSNLQDGSWHVAHIRRRGDELSLKIDDGTPTEEVFDLQGEKRLDVQEVAVGPDFKGNVQFVVFNDRPLLELAKEGKLDGRFEAKKEKIVPTEPPLFPGDTPPSADEALSFGSVDDFVALPHLSRASDAFHVEFWFKTPSSDGLMIYARGGGSAFIALEMQDGALAYHVGSGSDAPLSLMVPSNVARGSTNPRFDDNNWHKVKLTRTAGENPQHMIVVDGSRIAVAESNKRKINLNKDIYVGGAPPGEFGKLPPPIRSRIGIFGCFGIFDLNGKSTHLIKDALEGGATVLLGCPVPLDVCSVEACSGGLCIQHANGFQCDCSATSFTGPYCTVESKAYQFGKQSYEAGHLLYRIPSTASSVRQDLEQDRLTFGFMTKTADGVLLRILADDQTDYIRVETRDGILYLVYDASSSSSSSSSELALEAKRVDDGAYHVLNFIRTGRHASLTVDDLPAILGVTNEETSFKNPILVDIGGIQDKNNDNQIVSGYNGVIAGLAFNGIRVIDRIEEDIGSGPDVGAIAGNGASSASGDVIFVQRPYILPEKPEEKKPEECSGDGWDDEDNASGSGCAPLIPPVIPEVPVTTEIPLDALRRLLAQHNCDVWNQECILRILGYLPSYLTFTPAPTTPSVPMITDDDDIVFGTESVIITGVPVVEGGDNEDLTQIQPPVPGIDIYPEEVIAMGEIFGIITGVALTVVSLAYVGWKCGNVSGCMGASAQTAPAPSGASKAKGVEGYPLIKEGNGNGVQQVAYGSAGASSLDLEVGQDTMAMPPPPPSYAVATKQNAMTESNIVSETTEQSYSYNQTQSTNATSYALPYDAVPTENNQINSVVLTTDDQYVVAGSKFWPPQVWDIQSGEIIRSMKGDAEGCTNLRLGCDGSLLIGQVDTDRWHMPDGTMSSAGGGMGSLGRAAGRGIDGDKIPYQRIQAWNFTTGKPVDLPVPELCSFSAVTQDGTTAVVARTNRFGNECSVMLWDLTSCTKLKEIKCTSVAGFAEPISFLSLSPNENHAVAGFYNTWDGNANYVTFDLLNGGEDQADPSAEQPADPPFFSQPAILEVTAVINNEEAVTGNKQGELKVWNIHTGRVIRHLTDPALPTATAHAQNSTLTCLTVSADRKCLVSGATDGVLKVWELLDDPIEGAGGGGGGMGGGAIVHLNGHEDEVWCCAISKDGELVVSGSRDRTIRLWRVVNGSLVCTFNCNVDVFQVQMTSDKRTIVALGDRDVSRMLIMLKVVIQHK